MLITNLKEFSEDKGLGVYNCGSKNLCKFLINHDYFPVSAYLSKKSIEMNKPRHIWVFIQTPELSKLLKEWSSTKPNKDGDNHE